VAEAAAPGGVLYKTGVGCALGMCVGTVAGMCVGTVAVGYALQLPGGKWMLLHVQHWSHAALRRCPQQQHGRVSEWHCVLCSCVRSLSRLVSFTDYQTSCEGADTVVAALCSVPAISGNLGLCE
jgi:hypothetical protein